MRGFNEMFVWSDDKTGERLLPEIAQSGANSVRLVWSHEYGHKNELVSLIENTIEHKMIAMPECHDATGKWDADLQACINFWNDPVLIAGIEKNRQWTMLNIANEAGNHDISDEMFLEMYKPAIVSLREWGYTVPIVIDATSWGQNLDQLVRTAEELLNHDPLKNVVFSAHSYWTRETTIEKYSKVVDASQQKAVVLIVGEGPSITRVGECGNPIPLAYKKGMHILHEGQSGWLNWSWGGKKNGVCDEFEYFDMTVNGEFGNWQTIPGGDVVATDRYSVMQTSQRPASFYHDGVVRVSGIYILASKDAIHVGEIISVEVLIAPVNAKNRAFELSHDDQQGLVTFDPSSGLLTARAAGTVRFTATSEDGSLSWQKSIHISP